MPIKYVAATGDQIQLTCTRALFDALEQAEETQFLTGAGEQRGHQSDEVLMQPYLPPHAGSAGPWGAPLGMGTGVISSRSDAHKVTR